MIWIRNSQIWWRDWTKFKNCQNFNQLTTEWLNISKRWWLKKLLRRNRLISYILTLFYHFQIKMQTFFRSATLIQIASLNLAFRLFFKVHVNCWYWLVEILTSKFSNFKRSNFLLVWRHLVRRFSLVENWWSVLRNRCEYFQPLIQMQQLSECSMLQMHLLLGSSMISLKFTINMDILRQNGFWWRMLTTEMCVRSPK